jgi:hypothetical protein
MMEGMEGTLVPDQSHRAYHLGRWTQDYKEYLDTLVEKKMIGGYTNNSTTEDVDFEILATLGRTW